MPVLGKFARRLAVRRQAARRATARHAQLGAAGPDEIFTVPLHMVVAEMVQRLVHDIVKIRVNRAVRRYGCCTDRIFDEDTSDSGFDD